MINNKILNKFWIVKLINKFKIFILMLIFLPIKNLVVNFDHFFCTFRYILKTLILLLLPLWTFFLKNCLLFLVGHFLNIRRYHLPYILSNLIVTFFTHTFSFNFSKILLRLETTNFLSWDKIILRYFCRKWRAQRITKIIQKVSLYISI